jgi:hypothetical protein
VDLWQWRAVRRRAGHNIKAWVRGTPLARPAKANKRVLRRSVFHMTGNAAYLLL